MKSEAHIETPKSERYLKQFCKHFQHKVPADYDDQSGWVELPMGRVELLANWPVLTLSLRAQTLEQLQQTQDVVQRHLERFAFREDLEIEWKPEPTQ